MGASPKRIIRAMICDLQLSMALRAVSYLKKEGTVTPKAIKAIIREMNQGAERIQREGQRRGWVEAEMQ